MVVEIVGHASPYSFTSAATRTLRMRSGLRGGSLQEQVHEFARQHLAPDGVLTVQAGAAGTAMKNWLFAELGLCARALHGAALGTAGG